VAKTAEAVLFGLGNVIQAAFYVEEPEVAQQPKMNETQSERGNVNQNSETVATEPPTAYSEEENEKIVQEKERVSSLSN
jgi:hypothetical protein